MARPYGIQIGGEVFVARVTGLGGIDVATADLGVIGNIEAFDVFDGATNDDAYSARWTRIGDELQLTATYGNPPAAPIVLDALVPRVQVAVTPHPGAVMCPAEPENPRWIFTRRESLREHELRHTIQASMWGPMYLSAPSLGLISEIAWDVMGGPDGQVDRSQWFAVTWNEAERRFEYPPPAPADFSASADAIIELHGSERTWRTVVHAGMTGDPAWFSVVSPPPSDLLEGDLRARSLTRSTEPPSAWMAVFRFMDYLSNAGVMELVTVNVWEGLFELFWRAGRLAANNDDPVPVTVGADDRRIVTGDANKLRELLGSEIDDDDPPLVLVSSSAQVGQPLVTRVKAREEGQVTLRDRVPEALTGDLSIVVYDSGTIDGFGDTWHYFPVTLPSEQNGAVLQVGEGDDHPRMRPRDVLRVKWRGDSGDWVSTDVHIRHVLDDALGQVYVDVDLRAMAGERTLHAAWARSERDIIDARLMPLNFSRAGAHGPDVLRFAIDPWRELDLEFGATATDSDDHIAARIFLWLLRSIRYLSSNRSWSPMLLGGWVVWDTVWFRDQNFSNLEQSAAWESGDLYTRFLRSGDGRFAASEGRGNKPGSYGVVEGELLRWWAWCSVRQDSERAGRGIIAMSDSVQPPSVVMPPAAPTDTTTSPWRDVFVVSTPSGWPGTAAAGAEPAFQPDGDTVAAPPALPNPNQRSSLLYRSAPQEIELPHPLMAIPTDRRISQNQGFYFAAHQAGSYLVQSPEVKDATGYVVGPVRRAAPDADMVSGESRGTQHYRRRVVVGQLPLTARGVPVGWPDLSTPGPDLTLFIGEILNFGGGRRCGASAQGGGPGRGSAPGRRQSHTPGGQPAGRRDDRDRAASRARRSLPAGLRQLPRARLLDHGPGVAGGGRARHQRQRLAGSPARRARPRDGGTAHAGTARGHPPPLRAGGRPGRGHERRSPRCTEHRVRATATGSDRGRSDGDRRVAEVRDHDGRGPARGSLVDRRAGPGRRSIPVRAPTGLCDGFRALRADAHPGRSGRRLHRDRGRRERLYPAGDGRGGLDGHRGRHHRHPGRYRRRHGDGGGRHRGSSRRRSGRRGGHERGDSASLRGDRGASDGADRVELEAAGATRSSGRV